MQQVSKTFITNVLLQNVSI